MPSATELPPPPTHVLANRDSTLQTLRLVERVEETYYAPSFDKQQRAQDQVLDGLLAISKSSYFKTPDAAPIRGHLAEMGQDPYLMMRFVGRLEERNGDPEAMRDSLTLAEALQLQSDPLFAPFLKDISEALAPPQTETTPVPKIKPAKKDRPFWQKGKVWQSVAKGMVTLGAVATGVQAVTQVANQPEKPRTIPLASNINAKPFPQVINTQGLQPVPPILPQQAPEQDLNPITVITTAPEPIQPPIIESKTEVKPVETPKRPEANLKGDVLKDIFGPKLLAEAKKTNNELNTRDPERAARLNPEINKNRFTMLLMGMGSETDVQMTDTLLLLSYDVANNKIQLISIPRDTYAPEVDEYKKANGIDNPEFNAINTAFQIGTQTEGDQAGFDLIRKSVEDATGLGITVVTKVKIEALAYLVDNFTGPVTMDVDFDADLRNSHTGDTAHDGANVVFQHGVQDLNGTQVEELSRFRASGAETYREPGTESMGDGEIRRVHRLQKIVIPAVFKAMVDKLKPQGDNPFTKGLNLISKAPDAKKLYDVISEMQNKKLVQADSDIMSQILDYATTFVWAAAGGANISVDIPPIETLTFDEEHGLSRANTAQGESISHKYRPDLRVADSPDIHDPEKASNMDPLTYWKRFRDETAKFILGNQV